MKLTKKEIYGIVADVVETNANGKVSPDDTMLDLGMDSLDILEISMEIGKCLDIDIPTKRITNETTVDDIATIAYELKY